MTRASVLNTLALGVDPGLSGALAIYDMSNRSLVEVIDMPVRHTGGGKHEVDMQGLSEFMHKYAPSIQLAVIEEVGSRPGQGVVSMFRFGYASGVVAGAVAAHFIRIFFVKPQVWKSLTGLSQNKDLSREKASDLFPAHSQSFSRKKDDGRAEASILAWFGAERLSSHMNKGKRGKS